jgi:hypothetical protein
MVFGRKVARRCGKEKWEESIQEEGGGRKE